MSSQSPYLACLVVILFWNHAAANDCYPYGNRLTEYCHRSTDMQTNAYKDLSYILGDAYHQEGEPDFVVYMTLKMFLTAYPCSNKPSAAYYLYDRDPVPRVLPAEWVARMEPIFEKHPGLSDGDDALLTNMIHKLVQDTNPGCLRNLWLFYSRHRHRTFRQLYPDFERPPSNDSHHNSTDVRTTTTTTTAAATLTTEPTSDNGTVVCTVCDDVECLIHVHRQQCSPQDHYCMITVSDDLTSKGRNITRSCADEQICPGGRAAVANDPSCAGVELGFLPVDGVTCHFCCTGYDCNKPPYLLPVVGDNMNMDAP